MTELYNHPEQCAIPYQPNRSKLNELCVEMIWEYWHRDVTVAFDSLGLFSNCNRQELCHSINHIKKTIIENKEI